jgi:predicted ATPase
MKKFPKGLIVESDGPLLDRVKVSFPESVDFTSFPFSLPIIKHLKDIEFPSAVTFFVGENGTGKSTILEALADKVGFGAEGGSKNIHFRTSEEKTYSAAQRLGDCFTLSWRQKPKSGYFFRAESFFNVANYIDYLERECGGMAYQAYGGKSLHAQSHGESFLSFFQSRLEWGGFFIFDEPEAALSPQRQLTLLAIIHQMCKRNRSQFIIATHSPILLAYPGATIYSCDGNRLAKISYTDTQHYQITKNFLDHPGLYFKELFEE